MRRLDTATILTTILVLGLALRVFIAAVYLPLSGLANDLGAFNAWGQRPSIGPGAFYEPGYFSDYPPGYLYVLWLLGEIGAAFQPIVGVNITGGLVKIPGILSTSASRRLRHGPALGRRADRSRDVPDQFRARRPGDRGDLPGQPGHDLRLRGVGPDRRVGTLVLLGTIYLLGRGWTEAAAVGAVVAMLVKFQFAFLIPVVAVVGIKRHLFGRSTDPEHDGRRRPAS